MPWMGRVLGQLSIVAKWFGGGGPEVQSIAFAPDGQRLVVGYNYPMRACIYETRTGAQQHIIEEKHEERSEVINAIAYSPDGKLVAVGVERLSTAGSAGSETRIRDGKTGKLTRTLDGVSARFMQFSPDGKVFVVGTRILDMPKGDLVRRLALPEKFRASGIDFSPDGSLLAVSGAIDVRYSHPSPLAVVFEIATGRVVKTFKCPLKDEHKYCPDIRGCDLHPDGKRLAIGTTSDVFFIWDRETDEVETVKRKGGRWWEVRFSPKGELLAVSGAGGTVLLWGVNEAKELSALKGHINSVYALEFSPDGDLLASGGMDGTVRLWGPKDRARKKMGVGSAAQTEAT